MNRSYTQSHTINLEQMLFYKRAALICLGLIAVLVIMYAYALGSTVHFVIARSHYQKEAQELAAHIGSLQVAYLAKTQSINLDTGATMGLHEARTISFVNRSADTVSRATASLHEF